VDGRQPLLQVEDLRVEFWTARGTVYAVNGISFDISPGETLGIVGESGCGKSVTSLALLGILPRAARVPSGTALFAGRDLLTLSDDELRGIRGREIAMIFQDPMTSLNPVLTIGRQIREALEAHFGMERGEADKRTADLLDQVGIPSAKLRLKDYPHQFSGGMRQRAMIAMALACEPKLLIADEPTTALDVTIQAQILDLLRGLQNQRGMALILVTHNMGVVAEMARRVAVMYAGQIVEEQDAAALFAAPEHPYTAALLAAMPERSSGEGRLATIPGVVPGLYDRPRGCLFAPRCRYATQHLCQIRPELRPWADSRVRCHFPLGDPDREAAIARDRLVADEKVRA
jgi:dipeptide transport system ATP-binding protein